jgi:hypothetical protein
VCCKSEKPNSWLRSDLVKAPCAAALLNPPLPPQPKPPFPNPNPPKAKKNNKIIHQLPPSPNPNPSVFLVAAAISAKLYPLFELNIYNSPSYKNIILSIFKA